MTATHNVKAYRNNMDTTSGTAPFLGRYIPNETLPFEALCEQVANLSGQTAIQVRAIIEGAFDAIAELEKEALTVVHLDGLSVCAVIKGPFPTGDAEFDPERNSLELAIRLDDSVRLALAGVTPRMVTDDDLPKVRLDNVKDLEVERPVNLVHGQHPFRAAGHKLVMSDAGARVYMTDRSKAEHDVVVDEVHSDQLFTAHTAELLEGGDYTLWVESRAGVEDGPLQRDSCRVKYLRVVDPAPEEPEITMVQSMNEPDDTVNVGGDLLYIYGSGLNDVTEAKLYNSRGSEEGTVAVHFEPGSAVVPPHLESNAQVSLDWDPDGGSESGCKVSVTTAGGTSEHTVTVVKH